jgi:hypothetical protein
MRTWRDDLALLKQFFRPDHKSPPNFLRYICRRYLLLQEDELPAEFTRELLRRKPSQADCQRMRQLLAKNRRNTLAPGESKELECILRVSSFIDLLRAQVRRV